MMELEIVAAQVEIGFFKSAEVVKAANTELDKNYSDSLAELAMSQDLTKKEIDQLLRQSFKELDFLWPSPDEALKMLISYWLSEIVQKKIGPRSGIRLLINQVLAPANALEDCDKFVGDNLGLEKILGAFSSYDDVEENPDLVSYSGKYGQEGISEIDLDIIKLSNDWLLAT